MNHDSQDLSIPTLHLLMRRAFKYAATHLLSGHDDPFSQAGPASGNC